MIRTVLRRLGWTIVVLWFVVTLVFAMVVAIPADPARAMLGPRATPALVDAARATYCLDRGVVGRYGCWLARLAHGDLGESYRSKRSVGAIIAERAWPTAQLALAAIVLSLLLGAPLGILAAVRRGRWPDHAVTALALLGQSAPPFVVGMVLLDVFAFAFGWFPIGGYGDGGWDRLHHLVLPAGTLAAVGVATYARTVRATLGEVLDEDYIRTARAKGVSEAQLVGRHALRNALGPLVTLVGLDLGVLLGGAVVVEAIFQWPGVGRELLQAILDVDLPVIVGVVIVCAIAIIVANLLVDLVQLAIDPRRR
ncbi:MAG: ABC transporter permease [Proteobacteria bacterium]|nr:ABC transporter permease [Pseudomonadota bacterium]